MTIAGVTRELLVRYLDVWTPAALHAAKRVAFAYAWTDEIGAAEDTSDAHAETTEAALRGFAEFDDLLRRRRLTYVIVGPDAGASERLESVQANLGTSANLAVHAVSGDPAEMLSAALHAAGASGAPLFVSAQLAQPPARIHSAGRPTEMMCVLPPGEWHSRREALRADGFRLITAVEFVDTAAADGSRLVCFATDRATSLDAFKNALWAVDEYAGVRYRDPSDPARHLQDISLTPHPGPLRRALLDRLASVGPQTVTELRHYALTDTIYRSSDATRVISSLRHSGAVESDSAHGRLSGDTVVAAAGAAC
jgi:hypothetical protein